MTQHIPHHPSPHGSLGRILLWLLVALVLGIVSLAVE